MVTKLLGFFFLVLAQSVEASDLTRLSWGMKNLGDHQQILIDHYTSGIILGVPGEDIHPLSMQGLPRRSVTVAVLDTGIDDSHPALAGVTVKPGFNAINSSSDVKDSHGHGTHSACR